MREKTEGSLRRRVIVVGAGPAGLFAAIRAASLGGRVTVLERMPRPGLKLLASGGGHANLTNSLPEKDFVARFGPKGRFVRSALRELGRDALLDLLATWGVPCHAPDGFHYFPKSGRASDVLAALRRRTGALDVELRTGSCVTALIVRDGRVKGVEAGAASFETDAVVLAAGGAGYPGLGGGRSAYEMLRRVGHEIVPLVPGLVGLRTRETWPGQCAGIVVAEAEVRFADRARGRVSWRGELLFTHRGVSGPCILDASAAVCRLLLDQPDAALRLRIAEPLRGAREWRDTLGEWRKTRGKRTVRNLVAGLMPQRLATVLCEAHGIPVDRTMSHLPKRDEEGLLRLLEGPVVHIVESEGFDQAMVTSGGVSLGEVRSATLESRLVSGLFLAGEVLDVDGPTGGFNLQWAMSSGWLAGKGAATGGSRPGGDASPAQGTD
ncbi:aminoacetone oxidase family FAD-binding enzyme [Candidatus Sumerlaeota bacterium]|nr:aminoacetone oxidase family FAD-binding enzyme [Candidatus Sumerlaeota bacterium]